jgi:hypothetical protein
MFVDVRAESADLKWRGIPLPNERGQLPGPLKIDPQDRLAPDSKLAPQNVGPRNLLQLRKYDSEAFQINRSIRAKLRSQHMSES